MNYSLSGGEPLAGQLARVALGDRTAFDSLYAATAPKLFAVSIRILRSQAEAEEALQESYIKIWNKAGDYAPTGASPMSWLISIARNTAIDCLRRRREATTGDIDPDAVVDDAPTPEAAALLSSDVGRLYECFEELEDERASLIKKAYFSGYTYSELADATRTPIGTIKSWIRRSLMKLRECLERTPGGVRNE
jgi:RNA polymerase sigma-70 factor (ECF subfamily)